MPVISYRANTLSQHFPFLSINHGRTIIVPKQDQAFALRANVLQNPSDDDRDIGIPQAYYMHNAMPTAEGIQSIGFLNRIAALGGNNFEDIYILRDVDENRFLFSPSQGKNYIFDGNVGNWVSKPFFPAPPFADITVAYINGHTYIFARRFGMFEYNSTTKTFDAVPLIGVVANLLNGITSSNGFLIAWDDFTIYRSSVLNVLDFTPDITTGAGTSSPQDIKGRIVICLPLTSGFIIYTTANAVSATFTQNIRFPFQLVEINGSAGIAPPFHLAWQYNNSYHYIWTRGGLQKVDKTNAVPAFGDLTDFLSQKIFEDYNDITDTFQLTNLTTNLNVRLNIIERRYLVVSYGISTFTHALVYDLVFKRWGKLKIPHVAAFEFNIPSVFGDLSWTGLQELSWTDLGETSWSDLGSQVLPAEHAKETLAFLQADGTVKTVVFDLTQINNAGVCVLGKYQFVRERLLNLNEIEVESIKELSNFTLKVLSSMDGTTFLPAITPTLVINSGKYRKYQCSQWGKNHSLVGKGTFHLASIELTLNPGAKI